MPLLDDDDLTSMMETLGDVVVVDGVEVVAVCSAITSKLSEYDGQHVLSRSIQPIDSDLDVFLRQQLEVDGENWIVENLDSVSGFQRIELVRNID